MSWLGAARCRAPVPANVVSYSAPGPRPYAEMAVRQETPSSEKIPVRCTEAATAGDIHCDVGTDCKAFRPRRARAILSLARIDVIHLGGRIR